MRVGLWVTWGSLILGGVVAASAARAQVIRQIARFEYRGAEIRRAAFSADGSILVTASDSREVLIRDGESGVVLRPLRDGSRRFDREVKELFIDAEHGWVVLHTRFGRQVFDAQTGRRVIRWKRKARGELAAPRVERSELAESLRDDPTVLRVLAMPRVGNRAVTVHADRSRRLVVLQNGQRTSRVLDEHGQRVTGASLSGDGRWVHVRVDRETSEFRPVDDVAAPGWSRGDAGFPRLDRPRVFAVGSGSEFVMLGAKRWHRVDVDTRQVIGSGPLPRTSQGSELSPVGVSSDGRFLVCSGENWSTWVVELPGGKPLRLPVAGPPAALQSFVFSANGAKLWLGVEVYGGGPGHTWPRIDAYELLPTVRHVVSKDVPIGARKLDLSADERELLVGGAHRFGRLRCSDLAVREQVVSEGEPPAREGDPTIVGVFGDAGGAAAVGLVREDLALAVGYSGWRLHRLPSLEVLDSRSSLDVWTGSVSQHSVRFAVGLFGKLLVYELGH